MDNLQQGGKLICLGWHFEKAEPYLLMKIEASSDKLASALGWRKSQI